MGEGIAIDAAGNVYTAEAQLRGVTKYMQEPVTRLDTGAAALELIQGDVTVQKMTFMTVVTVALTALLSRPAPQAQHRRRRRGRSRSSSATGSACRSIRRPTARSTRCRRT